MPNLIIVAVHHWPWSIGGLGAIAGATTALVKKYRNEISKQTESFRSYVIGTIRLRVGRHFRHLLAVQFGLREYAQVNLSSFPGHLQVPSINQVRLKIDHVYVRLSLSAVGHDRIFDRDLLSARWKSVIIFGEPGSGKSSLTKKLFREACKRAYSRPSSNRLPVHVELRQLPWSTAPDDGTDEAGRWLLDQVKKTATATDRIHDPGFVFEAFRTGAGLIVFLDGLDEVPNSCLSAAQNAVHWFATSSLQESRSTTVIVTSRTQLQGTLSRTFLSGFSDAFTLAPFSPADVFAFLRRWPYQRPKIEESRRIFADIRIHSTLAEMCTNPLVLSMYVAQDQSYSSADVTQTVRIPETRPTFYSLVVGELLLFRRAEQLGRRVPGGTELRESRTAMLGRIALDHLLHSDSPANSISWSAAVATTRTLAKIPSAVKAEEALRNLAVDTGIFDEERPGESLRFMHLTLCEYLAAKEATESGEAELNQIFESAVVGTDRSHESTGDRRLWEVVVFCVALLRRSDRLAALATLDQLGASAELQLRAIRESRMYNSEYFDRAAHSMQDELAKTAPEHRNLQWFTRVKLLISCLTESERISEIANSQSSLTVNNLFLDLVAEDIEKLEQLFDTYLEVDPAEALALADRLGLTGNFRNPSKLIAAMEHPDFVIFGISQLGTDRSVAEKWPLILAEAGLRYELVAQILSEEPCPDYFRHALENVLPEHAWHSAGPVVNTLYGAVLAIATSTIHSIEHGQQSGFPRTGVLAHIPPTDRIGLPIGLRHSKNSGIRALLLPFSLLPGAALLFELLTGDLPDTATAALTSQAIVATLLPMFALAIERSIGRRPHVTLQGFEFQKKSLRSHLLGIRTTPAYLFPNDHAVLVNLDGRPQVLLPMGQPELNIEYRFTRRLWPSGYRIHHGMHSKSKIDDLTGYERTLQAVAVINQIEQFHSSTQVQVHETFSGAPTEHRRQR
jgi:hypothetical protein